MSQVSVENKLCAARCPREREVREKKIRIFYFSTFVLSNSETRTGLGFRDLKNVETVSTFVLRFLRLFYVRLILGRLSSTCDRLGRSRSGLPPPMRLTDF